MHESSAPFALAPRDTDAPRLLAHLRTPAALAPEHAPWVQPGPDSDASDRAENRPVDLEHIALGEPLDWQRDARRRLRFARRLTKCGGARPLEAGAPCLQRSRYLGAPLARRLGLERKALAHQERGLR